MDDILKDNDIVVITGPMKCGKTRQLIELYNHYKAIYIRKWKYRYNFNYGGQR